MRGMRSENIAHEHDMRHKHKSRMAHEHGMRD